MYALWINLKEVNFSFNILLSNIIHSKLIFSHSYSEKLTPLYLISNCSKNSLLHKSYATLCNNNILCNIHNILKEDKNAAAKYQQQFANFPISF